MSNTMAAEASQLSQWDKPDEVKKYERMVTRNFVKRGTDTKLKRWIYRPLSIVPSREQETKYPSAASFQSRFLVQKYDGKKVIKKRITVGGSQSEIEDYQQIAAHVQLPNGNWVRNEEHDDAEFYIPASEFMKQFEPFVESN